MKTKILKQLGLTCMVALLVNACTDEEYQRSGENNKLQVRVAGITAPQAWNESETRSFSSDSLDLEGMPVQRTDIGDEWVIATHVIDNGLFSESKAITRGVPIYAATKLPSMGISIYNGGTSGFGITTPIWKRIQAVNANIDGNWSILGEGVVWPVDEDKLTLLAFSPYPSQANGLTWSTDGRMLEYVVPVDVTKQPDLCLAAPVKDRTNFDGSGNHIVPFTFNHALTAATLKASAHQIKIVSATIKNVKTKGTLGLNNTTPVWNNVGVTGNRALSVNEQIESISMIDITKTDGHLMLIPQTLDDAAILEFVFDDLSNIPVRRITKTVRLNTITPEKKWEAGKQIFYNLQLKVEYNLTVNPTIINLSKEAGSYNTGIAYTTNNPQTPTVTANQGWISNIKVVNGKITFDYTTNSGSTERTAVLTITSGLTSKTVTVKQSIKTITLVESNCYIIAPLGKSVDILVSRANADGKTRISDTDIITAELVWQDTPGAVGTGTSCIASIKAVGVGSKGSLEIKPGATSGNALVAVKVNGKICWSWHIWITNYNPETGFKTHNGKKWLDRNIGATTNAPGNINTVGMYYQWGRKDPFLSSGGFYSSTTRTLYDASGRTIGYTFKPGYNIAENFETALQNPMYYFYAKYYTPPYQWSGTNVVRKEDWKPSTKTVYDPCPLGWRVPSESDFGSLSVSAATSGITLAALGYFPFGGNRSCWSGGIEGSGGSGACWTSSIKDLSSYVDGHYLSYKSRSASMSSYSKCMGMTIRCVQE